MTQGIDQAVGQSVKLKVYQRAAWAWALALQIVLFVCGVADLVLRRVLPVAWVRGG
ncbi:MAG: hypothetical protein KGY99_08155 [Phycisphaerae bacterium]|nr:hypothetical protein [Phycisphaerae bacterium]